MDQSQQKDPVSVHDFHPCFVFGPFLILFLYWAGSGIGFTFAYFEEYVNWCIPHIEGCTSISRTGRSGTSFYIFKFSMIPVACFTFVYWLDMARWNTVNAPTRQVLDILPTILGCLGAIALLLQMVFLGFDCGICRTIRSNSTSMFFLLTFVAQWLAWNRIKKKSKQPWIAMLYLILCLLLTIELAMFIAIPMLVENSRAIENAIAWRASYLISLAPAVSAFCWRRTKGSA